MMEKEKTIAQQKKDTLLSSAKHAVMRMSDEELAACDAFCEDYKVFLDKAKTEREAVSFVEDALQKNGFIKFVPGMELKAGDKIYVNNRSKAIIMATIGTAPITEGVRLNAAHIDSPRLDMKQHPLYEDNELAFFKTHYYGGIKKYQWTAIPLSLHGVVIRKDGTSVEICIGEDENDPIFCITDLLPHLAANQMKRTLNEGIQGEELNILVGSRPF
ncbi:MAG: aminopeptidase, partial [Oscillospiraceae bacterium]|nr:aminopeptidase [Oscillospiraceae bacterium]